MVKGKVNEQDFSCTLIVNTNGQILCCDKCFIRMAIPCAWCGLPITLGDPITLYKPKEGYTPPTGVVTHEEALVGCLRWECAYSGADRAGFWVPDEKNEKGRVMRVPSPLEIIQKLFGGGMPMILVGSSGNMPSFPRKEGVPQFFENIVKPPRPDLN